MFSFPILQRLVIPLFLLLSFPMAAQDEETPVFQFRNNIENITGDLYRASNGAWHAIFVVTSEGIVLADPINPDFANWLKGELDARFDVPVTHVIYSHSHFDHAAGAAAFGGATIMAHERVAMNMDGRYMHMPGDMIDRNDNGMIDREKSIFPPMLISVYVVCSQAGLTRLTSMETASSPLGTAKHNTAAGHHVHRGG